MKSNLIDMTGRRFGRLLVVSYAGKEKWNCLCDCGKCATPDGAALRKGLTKSCGCLARDMQIVTHTKHGLVGTPEYRTWIHIKQRCGNPKSKQYEDYGGRGITVCDRWLESFQNFIADMGFKPSANHSIERVKNELGYSPENCVWANRTEQARNMRPQKKNSCGVRGVRFDKKRGRWCVALKLNGRNVFRHRVKTLEEAIEFRAFAEWLYWGR